MAVLSTRLLRRVSWNVVDQGLSALSNLVLSVFVARTVDASSFGTFSIAFLIFGIAVAVTRSVVGQPLQIGFSSASDEVQRLAIGRALGCAALLGLAAFVGTGLAGAFLPAAMATAFFALAVILPGLLLQDSCRMAFFATARPAQAALIDAVWAVVQIGLLLACLTVGRTHVTELILAWGIGAAVSALIGLLVLRVRPRLTAGLSWVRDERKLTGYLLGEYVFGLGASQLAILLVGVLASPSAVGSLRAAQVLLGPLGVIGAAAFQFAVPEIARRPELSPRRRTLFGLGVSGGLGLITLVYGICLLAMPDRVGLALFGDSWRGAAAVLLAMSVSSLASSLANGPAGVLYGMGQARATFRLNLAKGPLLLVVVLFTTWQWGAVGAAWGLAFVEAAVLPAWWLTLRDALRRRPSADRQLLPQAAQ